MDETYGTYVDDECFDIHDSDDDTDAFCGPQEANMAATWAPRLSPNRTKINAKIDATNRCVLDVHFGNLFFDFGS